MRTIAAIVLAASLLAACASPKKITEVFDSRTNSGPCPTTGSIYDAARYVKFAPGPDQTYPNIEFTGEIIDVRMFCRYAGGDPIEAAVEIDFGFGKGDKAGANAHSYPYFIAVTRRNGKVLAKELYNVSADFKRGRVDGRTEKFGRIEIPRMDESISGVNFEIVVGFELTPEQLKFNRDGKRFRLDAEPK